MDKITVNTDMFGEISKDDTGTYRLTDAQYFNELEKRGLSNAKDVINTVNTVKEKFSADVVTFLKDEVIKTKDDAFLVSGTGCNSTEYALFAKKDVNIPAQKGETPEKVTKYGYLTYRVRSKTPSSWKKPDGLLTKIAEEIENALK